MLARIQQGIVTLLVILLLAVALIGIAVGSLALARFGLALVFLGCAGTLAFEFAWLYRSYAPTDEMRPSLSQLFRAWGREMCAAATVFLWRQPFRSSHEADRLAGPGIGPGIVLVHGFFCNRGIWNQWLKALHARGATYIAVNLEPVFGSIDDYAMCIEEAVGRLETATQRRPIVVAHSMGGLAVRAWARRFDGATRIGRLVTIGTPHAGTTLARHSQFRNARQMRINSAWLVDLASAEDHQLAARSTCFWSHCDNIVFPTKHATLPGADNRHLMETPHVHMVQHPAVYAETVRWLDAAESVSVAP